jgi:hypothetical protein
MLPRHIDSRSNLSQSDYGGQGVGADICAFHRDALELDEGVDSQRNAESAHKAEGQCELAGYR